MQCAVPHLKCQSHPIDCKTKYSFDRMFTRLLLQNLQHSKTQKFDFKKQKTNKFHYQQYKLLVCQLASELQLSNQPPILLFIPVAGKQFSVEVLQLHILISRCMDKAAVE